MDGKVTLAELMPAGERAVFFGALRGEEARHFERVRADLQARIDAMPRTYETAGKEDPFACLHYFRGGGDWYIVELDREAEQYQAFGLADPFGDGGEFGYISIVELVANGVELDLYFTPVRLSQLRQASNKQP